ncbi:unnamed protein product [Tilletia caries]|nr:unnamed protein product [Tilletia caries]
MLARLLLCAAHPIEKHRQCVPLCRHGIRPHLPACAIDNALVPHYARDLGRGVSRPLMKQTSFQARASRAHVLRRRLPSLDFRGAISNLMSPSTARMTDSRFDVRLGTQSTSCSRSTRSPSSPATLRGLAPSHVV